MSKTYDTVIVTRDGPLATVAMNRPQARNSINRQMMLDLYDALSDIAADQTVRVVVFRGEGKDFCPGADIGRYASGEEQKVESGLPGFPNTREYNVTLLLHEMKPVTIAAIRGGVAGAGFGWACACDMRIADETAKFNNAFLDVGVAGDMGVPWSLPRIVGAAKARELCFLPGKFGADEALRIGLVSKTFKADEFEAGLKALTDRLVASAPIAINMLKQNYVAAEKMGFADYISFEAERHIRIFTSEDTREAFKAFAEKRRPNFKNR